MIENDPKDQTVEDQEASWSGTEYPPETWITGPTWEPDDEETWVSESATWTNTDTVSWSGDTESDLESFGSTAGSWPQEVTNDCTTLVPANPPPAESTHQIPAYQQMMSGRLFTTRKGVLFIPDDKRKRLSRCTVYNTSTATCLYDSKVLENINKAKIYMSELKTGTPRFLFRGFHPKSGGGEDPRLNSTDGIVPHGFLGGKAPTSMWDIPDLGKMVSNHLSCRSDIISDFSSWSHILDTALEYALNGEGSMVAVLDTTSVQDHVWYSEDLCRAGLADHWYSDEYLIYGPVSGNLFHCIPEQMLRTATKHSELTSTYTYAFGAVPIGIYIEKDAIECARETAAALQPGASPESLAVLSAKFLSLRIAGMMWGEDYILDCENLDLFLYYTRDDLQTVSLRAGGQNVPLFDGLMDTSHARSLAIEVQLLQAIDNAVHALAIGVRQTFSRVLADANRDRLEEKEDR